MRKYFLIFVLIAAASESQAQTWQEWFEQKKTQTKYLIEQIAALKVYTNTLQKGYAIVEQGLSDIHSIKKGDFNLHQDYFSSLTNVNPQVKSYWKVAEIMALGLQVIHLYHRQMTAFNGQAFTNEEQRYFKNVLVNMVTSSSEIIDQMIKITTDGSSTMTDDQRISRIDGMYQDMQDQYSFVTNFSSEINLLALQRMKDQTDVNTTRSLFKQF